MGKESPQNPQKVLLSSLFITFQPVIASLRINLSSKLNWNSGFLKIFKAELLENIKYWFPMCFFYMNYKRKGQFSFLTGRKMKSKTFTFLCRFRFFSLLTSIRLVWFPQNHITTKSGAVSPELHPQLSSLSFFFFFNSCQSLKLVYQFLLAFSPWPTLNFTLQPLCLALSFLCLVKHHGRAPLAARWWRICLLMQETQVPSQVQEDPTCHGAAKPVSHNSWAFTLEPVLRNQQEPGCSLQLEKARRSHR